MTGRKVILLSVIIGLAFGVGACKQGVTDSPDKQKVEEQAADAPNEGLIGVIKKGKLDNYQSTTIGNAFESYKYLINKDWKMKQEGMHFTVRFLGWVEPGLLNEEDKKRGVTGKGLEVVFVVNPDGSYYVFMASRLETRSDGKIYTALMNDMAGVLSSIYANKKISL